MKDVEIIRDHKDIIAIIVRRNFSTNGVKFFTPEDFSQQLGYIHHKKGNKVKPHTHNALMREIHFTQEALFIKSGKLKVNIYTKKGSQHSTHILNAGDVILLAGGGHGFEALEDIDMIEVKQGPYAGDLDKTHFE
jgi:hypothetical protein